MNSRRKTKQPVTNSDHSMKVDPVKKREKLYFVIYRAKKIIRFKFSLTTGREDNKKLAIIEIRHH